jgi:hypothetical protein
MNNALEQDSDRIRNGQPHGRQRLGSLSLGFTVEADMKHGGLGHGQLL